MFIGRHFLTKNRVQSMSIDQADSSISIKWGKPRQHTFIQTFPVILTYGKVEWEKTIGELVIYIIMPCLKIKTHA